MAAARQSSDSHQGSVISKQEISERGKGTKEDVDTYDPNRFIASEIRTFFTCVMFLTRLPCPSWTDHHPAYLMRSMLYFPLTGAVVGAWGAVWYDAMYALFGSSIAATISTLSTVWLTGCFHEDGLADTFDGFGGGWGRVQILQIMKDSRVGTYGLVGTVLVLLLKVYAVSTLGQTSVKTACQALVLAHCLARWVPLPMIFFSEYLQDEEDAKKGMYNWFAQSRLLLTPTRLTLASIFCGATAACLLEAHLCFRVILVCITMAVMGQVYARAVIGGVVGDYLGACICVAEVLIYLVLGLDWHQANENGAVQKLSVLAAVAALPVLYCRRIDFYNATC